MPAHPRNSRVFTISFPDALARQVEQIAREESRNISELFREAFRLYQLQNMERQVNILRQRAQTRNSVGKEEDIQDYVDEIRRARFESQKA